MRRYEQLSKRDQRLVDRAIADAMATAPDEVYYGLRNIGDVREELSKPNLLDELRKPENRRVLARGRNGHPSDSPGRG